MDAPLLPATTLDILYAEMQRGFGGVHERLDKLNGQTRVHGERIAVLQSRVESEAEALNRLDGSAYEVQQAFSAHQALCPFDKNGFNPDALNLEAIGLRRRLDTAIGATLGATLAATVIEIIPRVSGWLLKFIATG